MKYKFLEHTADVKFRAFGNSLEEVFENSALALKEIIAKDINIQSAVSKKIKVQGRDNEALLYNFLEEFLFLLDAEEFLLSKIKKIKITRISIIDKKKISKSRAEVYEENNGKLYGYKLEAEVTGDKAGNYSFSNDVKAITYNQMFVKQERCKWVCQVVVDV